MDSITDQRNKEAIEELYDNNENASNHAVLYEDNEIKINQQMVTKIMSGCTDGEANAIAVIMVNDYSDPENPVPVEEYPCENAELQLHCMGGAFIAEINFDDEYDYKEVYQICNEYLNNLTDEAYDKDIFVLSLIPTRISYINMLVWNLMYVDGYQKGDRYKLVLGFDNSSTRMLLSDELDMDYIAYLVERELDYEQKKINSRIAELKNKDDGFFDELMEDVIKGDEKE